MYWKRQNAIIVIKSKPQTHFLPLWLVIIIHPLPSACQVAYCWSILERDRERERKGEEEEKRRNPSATNPDKKKKKKKREGRMATKSGAVLVLFVAVSLGVALLAGPAAAMPGHAEHGQQMIRWLPGGKSECRGTIAECLAGEEWELDSEISRRMLSTSRYISYGALKRGTVPCSRRGQSYYNCRPSAVANPYTRGCSRITHCRS